MSPDHAEQGYKTFQSSQEMLTEGWRVSLAEAFLDVDRKVQGLG